MRVWYPLSSQLSSSEPLLQLQSTRCWTFTLLLFTLIHDPSYWTDPIWGFLCRCVCWNKMFSNCLCLLLLTLTLLDISQEAAACCCNKLLTQFPLSVFIQDQLKLRPRHGYTGEGWLSRPNTFTQWRKEGEMYKTWRYILRYAVVLGMRRRL